MKTEDEKALRKMQQEIIMISDTIEELKRNLNKIKVEEGKLRNRLQSEGKIISVSDHALMRYIERVYNLDLEKLRSEILDEATSDIIRRTKGFGKIPKDDFQLVVKNYIVITIY